MYIVKTDYKSRISTELLNLILTRIIDGEDGVDEVQILTDISKTAVDIITGYSEKLYDIAPEWSKTGVTRNYQILNWAISIALYQLYQRIEDYDVPQKAIKNYDDTIDTLERLSTGKFNINLPAAASGTDGGSTDVPTTGIRRFGSKKPRSHNL